MTKPVIDSRTAFPVPTKKQLKSMDAKANRRIERDDKYKLLQKRKHASTQVQALIDKQIGRIAGLKGALKRAISRANYAKNTVKQVEKKPDYPPIPKYETGMKSEFYKTREWRNVRWQVISKADGKCSVCGRTKKDGIVIHVDHIKPRSKFPELELEPSNLQLLCEDCNLGKGARTQTF